MTINFTRLCSLTGVAALACCAVANAQEAVQNGNATARYTVLPAKVVGLPAAEAGTALPTWNGSFTYKNVKYSYNMVGTAPSTGTSTTVAAYIIPIKIVITKGSKKTTFDPSHVLPNGRSVTTNTVDSPIFDSTTTYIQGGVNLGTTQYVDAFQRGNFWGTVKTKPNYHLLLGGPTVMAEQTLSPPAASGLTGNPFGNLTVAEVDINWFDAQLISLLTKLKIPANSVPIFLTYNTYLTEGGCCIGGYHSSATTAMGVNAYMHASYIDKAGDFAQDVSALSHELSEWADDPLVVNKNGNPVQCGILEVGDPEEGFTNYGAFPYAVNGFSYNLQDEVFLPYFGAPTSTSVNNYLTFQGNPFHLTVCSNGG